MEDLVILVASVGPLRDFLDRGLTKVGYTVMFADDWSTVSAKLTYNPAPIDVLVLGDERVSPDVSAVFSEFALHARTRYPYVPVVIVGIGESRFGTQFPWIRRDDPDLLPKVIQAIERFRRR